MLIIKGKEEGGKKEVIVIVGCCFFFTVNTLFLSGMEVKRHKHLTAHPLPNFDKVVMDPLVISSSSPLLSPLCSLPSHHPLTLLEHEPQHDTVLLSTKVKEQGFDCTSIHPPYLARKRRFSKTCKKCV